MKPTRLNPKVPRILWAPIFLGGIALALSQLTGLNMVPTIDPRLRGSLEPLVTPIGEGLAELAIVAAYLWTLGAVLYLLLVVPLCLCAQQIRDDFNAAHAPSHRTDTQQPSTRS
ncbi:MAG: hypothetical protein ACTS3F_06480 [Phycisphaerales bacterium]